MVIPQAQLPPKSKSFAVPSRPLARVSEDLATSPASIGLQDDRVETSGLIGAYGRRGSPQSETAHAGLQPNILGKQILGGSIDPAPPAPAPYESPFEALQFQVKRFCMCCMILVLQAPICWQNSQQLTATDNWWHQIVLLPAESDLDTALRSVGEATVIFASSTAGVHSASTNLRI